MDRSMEKLKHNMLSEIYYFFGKRRDATFKLTRYYKRYWNSWNRVEGFRERCKQRIWDSQCVENIIE
jgi:hypothetical protein